jgi:hypothetical protein
MWTTLTLIAALGPVAGQSGDLELNNIRSTYGLLGAPRPDDKLLPGDMLYVAFDIDNIRIDADGRVLYSLGLEVVDSKNKPQFKRDPVDIEAVNSLGGTHVPAYAKVEIGTEQPPGDYTMRVTVTDRAAKKSKSFDRKFTVQNRDFGLVRVALSRDPGNSVATSTIGAAGEDVWLHFFALGFERAGAKKNPDIAIELQILDENGRPTLSKPFVGDFKEWPKDNPVIDFNFPLALNRPGKFTINLKATDRLSKKESKISFPITVLEAK